MKKMMAMVVTAAMLAMTAVTGCSTPAGNGADTASTQKESGGTQQESQKTADKGEGQKVIGVSLMTLQYEFFQDMKAGIEAAAGDDYKIVFIQGGATQQFSMVPLIYRPRLMPWRISAPRMWMPLY